MGCGVDVTFLNWSACFVGKTKMKNKKWIAPKMNKFHKVEPAKQEQRQIVNVMQKVKAGDSVYSGDIYLLCTAHAAQLCLYQADLAILCRVLDNIDADNACLLDVRLHNRSADKIDTG